MVLPEKGLVSRVSRSPNGWQLSGVEGGLHHVLHVPSGSLWAASLVEAVGAAGEAIAGEEGLLLLGGALEAPAVCQPPSVAFVCGAGLHPTAAGGPKGCAYMRNG